MVLTSKSRSYCTAIVVFVSFALNSQIAQARMYQWLNPETGNTQLSGKPPTWYRSQVGGPRVFVYDNGQLVDDSAVAVSDLHRTTLRNRAFELAREEDQIANKRRAELKAAMQRSVALEEEKQEQEAVDEQSLLAELLAKAMFRKPEPAPEVEKKAEPEVDTVEQLKSIIEAWDLQQSNQARKVLQDNPQ